MAISIYHKKLLKKNRKVKIANEQKIWNQITFQGITNLYSF